VAEGRLGRLVMRAPNPIQVLIGIAMVDATNDQVVAALETLTPQAARETLADLRGLPAFPDIVDCDDQCMRLETIAEIAAMARFGPAVAEMNRDDPSVPLPPPASFGFQAPIHFDDLLREHNRLFDQWIAAEREPIYSKRRAVLAAFEADRVARLKGITGSSSTAAIKRLIYDSIGHSEAHRLYEDKMMEKFRLVQLALMMVIYRGEHGAYPKAVAELGELGDAGRDIFADEAPVRWMPEGKFMYSVGALTVRLP
jgi:hypothetical protein